MSLFCSLLGHKPRPGWQDGYPYYRVTTGETDGIGREHAWLYRECARCEKEICFGKIHRPKEWFDGKLLTKVPPTTFGVVVETVQFNDNDVVLLNKLG